MQTLELMKTYVIKTTPEATLGEAVDLMDLYQVNGLPVISNEDRLIGILTEHDVMRALLPEGRLESRITDMEIGRDDMRALSLADRLRRLQELRVGDYMTHPVHFVAEDTSVLEAAALMLEHRLKRLPVVSENGHVVGVLNRIDVCQAILEGIL